MEILLVTNPIRESKNYICELLQNSWDSFVKNDKRKRKRDFLNESDFFRIIDSKEKYDALDNNNTPELILIVPELNWANDEVNEGYDMARELVFKKYRDEFIQVVFLSILERTTLANNVDIRNKGLVEAFPHLCLLDNEARIEFEYYSDIHYKLIKHLSVSNEGRLQKISHEMNSVKANILRRTKDISSSRADLIAILEELILFEQWADNKLTFEIEKVKLATTNDDIASVSKNIEHIIDEIGLKLSHLGESRETKIRDKSNYKVLIIEDNKEYRDFFRDLFSVFFNKVYPDKNDELFLNKSIKGFRIAEVNEIIKSSGKDYDIFLLDLLYKDDAGNWLTFNGLDLYRLIKKVNPYSVLRVITSLPRGIVARLVEIIMTETEKPKIDHVFTKKYGLDALRDSIYESVDKIENECVDKERIKTQLFPIPKAGIFDKSGIRDVVISLLTNRLAEFEKLQGTAIELFNFYLGGQLTHNTEKWNKGILGKGSSFSKPTETFFLEKIVNIMIYRLISIDMALDNDYSRIYFSNFQEKIANFSGIKDVNNEFFYSIGFRLRDKPKNKKYFALNFTNLLPYESLFIARKKSEKYRNLKLTSLPKFSDWIQKVIFDFSYLGSVWKELGIREFDWFKRSFMRNSVSLLQVQTFFASLYSNSMKPLVIKVIEHIRSNAVYMTREVDEELSKLPDLKLQIDLLLNIE